MAQDAKDALDENRIFVNGEVGQRVVVWVRAAESAGFSAAVLYEWTATTALKLYRRGKKSVRKVTILGRGYRRTR